METWDCESKIVQYRWADTAAGKKRFKAIITPLHEAFHRDVVEPYLSQWRQYVYRLSVSMLTRAREHAVHERRRLNTLNYGDLLNVTARVLRENAHVRRALQQKYSFLFVDEFQDTDPVQAEIVFLLAADERNVKSGRGRTDWRTLPLRPGALFVVGDPKQSIYRFRRADIEIYNVVHDRFSDPATGRVLPLTLNFRSRPKLCRVGQQGVRNALSCQAHSAFAALRAARSESRRRGPGARAESGRRRSVHPYAHLRRRIRSPGGKRGQHRSLYSDGSGRRPEEIQRFPHPHEKKGGTDRSLCHCARGPERSD